MEATVEKLEAMFEKAESDLDLISKKLDNEFSDKAEATSEVDQGELLDKISTIKKDFKDVVSEAEEIKKAQMEAICFFRNQMLTVCGALQRLQDQSGTQDPTPDEVTALQQLIGISTSRGSSDLSMQTALENVPTLEAPNPDAPQEGAPVTEKESEASTTKKIHEASSLGKDLTNGRSSPEMSAVERRASGTSFAELTESEFLTVSDLVRGRVKLEEVNQVYRILWDYFKTENNSSPLTSMDMTKMGLKITGQTGEAKLKVLRSLKILKILKNGAVQIM